MTNPAIQPQPSGDIDIAVPDDERKALEEGRRERPGPEPSVDPKNLDHPEEIGGE